MANDDVISRDESFLIKPRRFSTRSPRTSVSYGLLYFDSHEPELSLQGLQTFKNEYYREFITGSSYIGQWNSLGMNGKGRYTMLHGVVYEGDMKDGQFHGDGRLIYPEGQEIIGKFYKGTMISWIFKFKDGYSSNMDEYCKFPDRRYMNAIALGKSLPAQERITTSRIPRKIPEGHYDVGDGFYDPKTKWVYKYNKTVDPDDPLQIPYRQPLRYVMPLNTERYDTEKVPLIRNLPFVPVYQDEEFILNQCRRAWDEPTGYRPDLYEFWMSGRKREAEKIRAKIKQRKPEDEESLSIRLLHYMKEVVDEDGVQHFRFSGEPIGDEREK